GDDVGQAMVTFIANRTGGHVGTTATARMLSVLIFYVGSPTIVLVNEATAAGAELVAPPLQENDRPPVGGGPTMGYRTATGWFQLSSGTMLRLPIGDLLNAKLEALQGNGLVPDVPVSPRVGDPDPALGLAQAILARTKGATQKALREAATLAQTR